MLYNAHMIDLITSFKNLFGGILKDRDGYISRKLVAAWILTFIALILVYSHYIAFFWLVANATEQLVYLTPLLSGEQFAVVISIIWTTYFGANIGSKYFAPKVIPGDEGEA